MGARRGAVFVGNDIYRQAAYGSLHPLAIARVESVVDLCRALEWFGPGEYDVSPRATEDELAAFHDREYIHALRCASERGHVDAAARERYGIGTMENPLFPGVFERASTSVGGSIRAARLALQGRVAFHPAGGTHHGRPGRASGFCYFNDPAFALLTLLDAGLARVAYVDLDAHHCDAVQDAFANDARVRMVSIHETGRWPHTGEAHDTANGTALNLPVPRGFDDPALARLMGTVVLPHVAAFRPEAVVLTCGADALAGDPLAHLALTNARVRPVQVGGPVHAGSCRGSPAGDAQLLVDRRHAIGHRAQKNAYQVLNSRHKIRRDVREINPGFRSPGSAAARIAGCSPCYRRSST